VREPQDRSAFLLCALSKVCGPHRGACLPLSPSHSHSACVGDLWRLSPPAGERSSAGGRCETDRGPAPEKSCAHNPRLSLFSRLLCFPLPPLFLPNVCSMLRMQFYSNCRHDNGRAPRAHDRSWHHATLCPRHARPSPSPWKQPNRMALAMRGGERALPDVGWDKWQHVSASGTQPRWQWPCPPLAPSERDRRSSVRGAVHPAPRCDPPRLPVVDAASHRRSRGEIGHHLTHPTFSLRRDSDALL
jgi:hypothetical protein